MSKILGFLLKQMKFGGIRIVEKSCEAYGRSVDPETDEIFLFGAGLIGAVAASTLKGEVNIKAICDNSIEKQGRVIEGIPCISPNELVQYQNPFVLISTNKYYKSLHQQLEDMKIPHCSLDAYVMHKHFNEFEEVFNLLDDESKEVYSGVLLGRMTWK